MKRRLLEPPVLNLQDNKGKFHLYSDTSKFITGGTLYQIQNGKPLSIVYGSKIMPEKA